LFTRRRPQRGFAAECNDVLAVAGLRHLLDCGFIASFLARAWPYLHLCSITSLSIIAVCVTPSPDARESAPADAADGALRYRDSSGCPIAAMPIEGGAFAVLTTGIERARVLKPVGGQCSAAIFESVQTSEAGKC
jgi:hypothetical protein